MKLVSAIDYSNNGVCVRQQDALMLKEDLSEEELTLSFRGVTFANKSYLDTALGWCIDRFAEQHSHRIHITEGSVAILAKIAVMIDRGERPVSWDKPLLYTVKQLELHVRQCMKQVGIDSPMLNLSIEEAQRVLKNYLDEVEYDGRLYLAKSRPKLLISPEEKDSSDAEGKSIVFNVFILPGQASLETETQGKVSTPTWSTHKPLEEDFGEHS